MNQLTPKAQGTMAEMLFVVLAVLGSRGVVKAGLPMVDDEGRDVEIHLGGRFRAALAIQVKGAIAPLRRRGRRHILQMTYQIRPSDIIDDPRYWYFFSHIDTKHLRLDDYVFLVPSQVVHAHLMKRSRHGRRRLAVKASMEPNARDRWTPYRLNATALGQRLVELMRKAPQGLSEGEALTELAKRRSLCLLGTR